MELPKPGLAAGGLPAALRQHLKSDLLSGLLVFLIALPLCLAISKASGFPPVAGILTAIIGGLVVTLVGGSALTIKGPAVGLVVVAAGAVHELGRGDALLGYKLTLATIVVAGVLQIILGLLRPGVLVDFFPSAAIHGMMAAIGITVMLKQVFVLTGTSAAAGQEVPQLLAELPGAFRHLNPDIFLISLVSLALLFGIPALRVPGLRRVPVQLLVLLVSIPLARYFDLGHEHTYLFLHQHHYQLGPDFLVKLPTGLRGALTLPDFSQLVTGPSVKYTVLFALVGSVESLLSTKAVDLLDPQQRRSDLNRDLLGVGIGNVLAGLLGGLPMISEIVRSSANVANGARTRWANFYHGLLLLLFVSFGAGLLTQIPLAALGAMLLYTGWRLTAPREFGHMLRIGGEQLAVFVVTIGVSLGVGLLAGIGAGILSKLLINLGRGLPLRSVLRARTEQLELPDGSYLVRVLDAAVFSNYPSLRNQLDLLPKGRLIVLDLSGTRLVDHTAMENLARFRADAAREGGLVEITGLQRHRPVSGYPTAARVRNQLIISN